MCKFVCALKGYFSLFHSIVRSVQAMITTIQQPLGYVYQMTNRSGVVSGIQEYDCNHKPCYSIIILQLYFPI